MTAGSESVDRGVVVIDVTSPGGERQHFALHDDFITVGRSTENDIALKDPMVSRHHARLEKSDGAIVLLDLGSANGTTVDGVEVEPRVPRRLAPGDTVGIGTFTLAVRGDEDARARPTVVPVRRDIRQTMVAGDDLPPRLVVTTPAGTTEYALDRDSFVLGRDKRTADIFVNAQVVSRRHAELRRSNGGFEIADLGSKNGLVVDGRPVTRKQLSDADVVWITQDVSLTYRSGGDTPTEQVTAARVPLKGRRSLTLGRAADNDVHLDHPMVSGHHARLTSSGTDAFSIEDLGSTNGTYVNGDRVATAAPQALRSGDVVRIGPISFTFSPTALEPVDESRSMAVDAVHLNRVVSKGLNLLQDISLSIHAHEFVALVGTSGAGKSTLLDALNAFRPATAGEVLINGSDLYRNLDAYRTQLGYVPQDDIVHKELTPYQALDYSARLRLPGDTTTDERHQRVVDALETLGIAERRDVPIQSLSGGQRKRVSIGAELITRPGLFFLDEATSGLDPGTESQMMRLLRRLADQGHTIILVTHATKNVMLCDQVVFMCRGGHLAYYGPPDQALDYFGVKDFDEIYLKLDEELSPPEWGERYRSSEPYRKFVVGRLQQHDVATHQPPPKRDEASPLEPGAKVKDVSSARQLVTLSARNLAILARDRLSVLLMLAIAPVIGLMDLTTWKRADFVVHGGRFNQQVNTNLFLAVLVAVLVGAIASMREIVKETDVYRRERMVTLKIGPYVLSKLWIGILLALYQAGIFLLTKHLASGWPPGAGALGQVYVTLTLATLSGVVMGLFISAVAANQNVAPLLLIVFLVPQFMFGGPLLKLGTGGAAKVLGTLTITKWAYEGLQRTTGINALTAAVPPTTPTTQWAALGAILAVLMGLVVVAQKWKDRRR